MKYLVVQAFWYFEQVTGEFYYRILSPGQVLAEDPRFQVKNIHVFHPLFPQLALSADLLILHLLPDAEVWQLIQLRKQAGKVTLYEIADNFLCPGPWVGPEDAYRHPQVRQQFLLYAHMADACTFSTPEVAEVFAQINPRQVVFENQSGHFSKNSPAERPLVIGWGGSKGHRDDLAAIAPVLLDFFASHPDACFVYMGVPEIYDELFEGLGPQGRAIPSGPIEVYYAFLEQIHVGLAPLADTAFNQCRSDVKFLEYASHHVVPVLSDVAPYRRHAVHGETALLFKDHDALRAILEELYHSPERVQRLADQAYHYAKTERDRLNFVKQRADYFAELIGYPPNTPDLPDLPASIGLLGYMRKVTHQYDRGLFFNAEETLNEVLKLHPSYSLAQIYYAKVLINLNRFDQLLGLQQSVAPIHMDLFLESVVVAARSAGYKEWRILLNKIQNPVLRIQLDPDYDQRPQQRAQAILAHHPYDYTSLEHLAFNFAVSPTVREDYLARMRFLEGSDALDHSG